MSKGADKCPTVKELTHEVIKTFKDLADSPLPAAITGFASIEAVAVYVVDQRLRGHDEFIAAILGELKRLRYPVPRVTTRPLHADRKAAWDEHDLDRIATSLAQHVSETHAKLAEESLDRKAVFYWKKSLPPIGQIVQQIEAKLRAQSRRQFALKYSATNVPAAMDDVLSGLTGPKLTKAQRELIIRVVIRRRATRPVDEDLLNTG